VDSTTSPEESWVLGRSSNPSPLTPEQLARLSLLGKLDFLGWS
jgi:hypothetical protein